MEGSGPSRHVCVGGSLEPAIYSLVHNKAANVCIRSYQINILRMLWLYKGERGEILGFQK